MASVRNFKKELRYLFNEMTTECYVLDKLNPELGDEKVNDVIKELLAHYNDYISRSNHINGKSDPHLVRQHFQSIRKDLIKNTLPIIAKLS
jgi:hypothetical protein